MVRFTSSLFYLPWCSLSLFVAHVLIVSLLSSYHSRNSYQQSHHLCRFPGMVMYYNAYSPDRNSSGLQHNLAMIFFSLQAIVSSIMAMTKPDVRKSIYNIYDHNNIGRIFNSCKWFHPKPVNNHSERAIGVVLDDENEGAVNAEPSSP